MSVRTEFADTLAADWADISSLATVRVIATERDLGEIHETTALIRVKSLGRTPGAPLSHRNVGILLTLISGHTDLDLAGDELDGLVSAALDYLDPRFMHEDAAAVGYGERLAYDIPLTIIAQKE